MIRQAYTSVVVGPLQVALGLACTVGVTTLAASAAAPSWLVVLVAAVMLLLAAHLSTVRLGVAGQKVTLGQGPWPQWPARVIPAEAIADTGSEELRWGQTFGFGVHVDRKATRMTVRPGPAVVLRLHSGEVIRVSTPHPDTARALLAATTETKKEEPQMGDDDNRPWFGPKRIGYGIRPQTWQGWTMVTVFIAAVIIIVLITH